MSEFSWIETYLSPLARNFPGAHNLKDDAASLNISADQELVITTDTICEGTHFIGDEPPGLIAQKLLRTNLSDLAAKGATPFVYFLNLTLPKHTDEHWLAAFTEGLQQDQTTFNIHLAGGDTTSTKGPLVLSLTALGTLPKTSMLMRSGAEPGDGIYVSGTLGDSALGLRLLQEGSIQETEKQLIERYHLPQPRVALGRALLGIASACMDISDGLLQDLGHLCATSGCGAEILFPHLPVSPPARQLLQTRPEWQDAVYAGGDDYELLFTVSPAKSDQLALIATRTGIPITRIGEVTPEKCVHLRNERGDEMPVARKGYRHF